MKLISQSINYSINDSLNVYANNGLNLREHPAFSFLVKTSQNSVKKRKLFEPKRKLKASNYERSATNVKRGPPKLKASFFGLAIEMNWIKFDDELFDLVDTMTDNADTVIYGRVTYEMMQNYWPNAGKQPNATKHEKEHAAWYSKVSKVVLSTTMRETGLDNTKIIADQLTDQISDLKSKDGKDILIFGSPSVTNVLLSLGLIDEFWLFVNPVLIGQGIPLFKEVNNITKLNLIDSKTFACGVIGLHFEIDFIK